MLLPVLPAPLLQRTAAHADLLGIFLLPDPTALPRFYYAEYRCSPCHRHSLYLLPGELLMAVSALIGALARTDAKHV